MSLQAFLGRVRLGRWIVRRDEYWDQVTQEILRQSHYRAVHDRVKALREIEQVRLDVLEAIQPKVIDGRKIYPVRPSTLEGMVGALVKIDKLADDKRDMVLTMIEPQLVRDSSDRQDSTFSPDEWRDVAKMLLERRRIRQQERLLGAGGSDAEGSKAADQKEGDGQEGASQKEDDQEGGS
jgi:hypothetical protein